MKIQKAVLFSLIISLLSIFVIKADQIDIFEFSSVVILAIVPYFFFFYWISNRSIGKGNYLVNIFSISYILSFTFILWINYYSVSNGSRFFPNLPGDGLSYFKIGEEIATSSTDITTISLNYAGYPLFLSWIFKIFGVHLIFGLLANWILLYFNIFLISEIAFILHRNEKHFRYTFILLLLTAQFVASGFMLLKDGFIIFSVTIATYASIRNSQEISKFNNILVLTVSVILMALFRFTFIFIPILIFMLLGSRNFKNLYFKVPVATVILLLGIFIGEQFALMEIAFDQSLEFATSNTVISRRLENNYGFVATLLSGYDNWSLTKKLSFLPISTGVQYLTPFDVLNLNYFHEFPYYIISKNFNLIWLIYVGPLLIFSYSQLLFNKNDTPRQIRNLAILGLFLYITPAFIYGGAIPRYAVPFFALIFPFLSITVEKFERDKIFKRKWKSFYLFYFFIASFFLIGFISFKTL